MKFHLVLAVVLCSITASLCSEEEQISSANMSSIAIAKKLIEKSSIQCFLNWLSRLGKNAVLAQQINVVMVYKMV
ncbi:uncharacterized protein LOC111067667 isoform X2 [Drosophila obscura]|uniref:uncharacterized protein LOC111067667 isoform X2 n=1 Tax=Drosophila obscura TaxID=7282 RepID=UPI000BA17515|nr:uncharacterized protein LOC111067667 isoform X2 [Drosophila obscura]